MMVQELLQELQAQGIELKAEGDHLCFRPKEAVTGELLENLRQHKAELLACLSKPHIVDAPPQWHAEEVARCVEEEGVCIFWSDLFQEVIAFVKDESFQGKVPSGIVVYTSQELAKLFPRKGKKASKQTLLLTHEGKKQGGRITSFEPNQGRSKE